MSRKKEKKKTVGIYLWKLILIIITAFVVFLSIECFWLIEKTAKKIISGFSKELGTSSSAEADIVTETSGTYNIYHINNMSNDSYTKKGPMLIYNPANEDILISKLECLTEYNLDEDKEKVDKYNLYVVTAKKYDNNKFLITRVSSQGYLNDNTDSSGIKHTGEQTEFKDRFRDDLCISIPKNGFVLLFQSDTKTDLLPSIGEILQFNNGFDYKNIENGANSEGYGTITKVSNNGEKFEVEKNVLDIYRIKYIYESADYIKNAKYPILIYNDSGEAQALNSEYILSKMENNISFSKVGCIAEKYDGNKYKVVSRIYYDNPIIPKDGIALVFGDFATYVTEMKCPVIDDILDVRFDYTNLSGKNDEGEYGFIYTYRDSDLDEEDDEPLGTYNIYNINNIQDDSYSKRGPVLLWSDIDILAYNWVTYNSNARYNLYIVTAKKYENNKFLVTRSISANHKFSELSITVPKDGVVLLFQHDSTTESDVPKLNEILEINFNYKEYERGTKEDGYGTISRHENSGEQFKSEKGVLDIYKIQHKNSYNGNIQFGGFPIIVYNSNSISMPINQLMDKASLEYIQWWDIFIVQKYLDDTFITVSQTYSGGFKFSNMEQNIPPGGFALIFADQSRNYHEMNYPEVGDILYFNSDFDYKSEEKGTNTEGYGYIYRCKEEEEEEYEETPGTYNIYHINNMSNDSYTKKGPILIYNPENKDALISKLKCLTEYNLDEEIQKVDAYNFYVVTAKKYADNKFLITRVSSLGDWNTDNMDTIVHTGEGHWRFANRTRENLFISIPKDGFVLLFQNDTNLSVPKTGEILQFNDGFDYKNIENRKEKTIYGTIAKIPNAGEKFVVEKNVLDIYSIKNIYKFETYDNNVNNAKYPVFVYNNSNTSQAMNSEFILDRIGNYAETDKQSWRLIIFAEKDDNNNRYRVINTCRTDGTPLKDITNSIPKDGFALIFSDWSIYVTEAKLPVVGDLLYVDFDYTNLSGIKEDGEFGFIYTYRYFDSGEEKTVINNGLTPLENGDEYLLERNEEIVNDTDIINVNLYNYNENINSKYWEQYDNNKKSYYPFFATATPLAKYTAEKDNIDSDDIFELNQYLNIDYDNKDDNRNNSNDTLNNLVRKSMNSNHINKKQGAYAITDVIKKVLNEDGYPVLANTENDSLAYLYGGENEYINSGTVKVYKNLSGLFIYNKETKEYGFDSREVTAQYDAEIEGNKKFDLYKESITPNFMSYQFGNFMPFNDIRYATKVTTIDKSYFEKLQKSALYKEDSLEFGSRYNGWYKNLADNITTFIKVYDKYDYNDVNSKYEDSNFNDSDKWTFLGLAESANRNYLGSDSSLIELHKKISKAKKENSNIQDLEKNESYQYYDNMYNIDYDDIKDYHFGLAAKVDFRALGTEQRNGKDIVYEFAGDDDVLVYIDDVLFLELAGIHLQVGGSINFTTGEVTYKKFGDRLGGVTDITASGYLKTQKFSDIMNASDVQNSGKALRLTEDEENKTLPKNTIHTLKFYFLERGSGSSLCNMNFNLNLIPSAIKVSGEKKWTYYDNGNSEPEDKPDKIKVNLYRRLEIDEEGTEELINTQEITADNGWKYEFTKDQWGNPLKYGIEREVDGERIIDVYVYTVKEEYADEEDAKQYSKKYLVEYERDELNSTDIKQVINIVNKYICTDIQVEKKWDDNNNETVKRPDNIQVKVSAKLDDNDVTEDIFTESEINNLTQTLNKDNDWSYTWHELPKYKMINNEHREIEYSVKEVMTDQLKENYYQSLDVKKEITEERIQTFTITNTKYKEITFVKVDSTNNEKTLEGAIFSIEQIKDVNGNKVDKPIIRESNMSGDDGVIILENLDFGTYILTETKAPDRYNKIKPIEIEIKPGLDENGEINTIVHIKNSDLNFDKEKVMLDLGKVDNKKGFILPVTGGSGSSLFIIVGGILIIISFDFIRPILIINGKYKKKPRRRKRRR